MCATRHCQTHHTAVDADCMQTEHTCSGLVFVLHVLLVLLLYLLVVRVLLLLL